MGGDRRLATGIPTRLSAAEGRRFGLTVGGAFLVLALLARWRGHLPVSLALGVLAALLTVGAAGFPRRLGPVFRAWMGLAHALSRVTTPVFLGLVYFVLLTPVGLLMRVVGRRALVRPATASSCWMPRNLEARRRNDMERQF